MFHILLTVYELYVFIVNHGAKTKRSLHRVVGAVTVVAICTSCSFGVLCTYIYIVYLFFYECMNLAGGENRVGASGRSMDKLGLRTAVDR